MLIPAVNRAGLEGWDMVKVAADIKAAAEAQGQQVMRGGGWGARIYGCVGSGEGGGDVGDWGGG